jgi:hypothetical protein
MRIITLDDAVRDIVRTCGLHRRRSEQPPFSFIVGAGLSCPEVPLASGIIDHCRCECPDATEPPGLDAIGRYDSWFRRAYPELVDRQPYIRQLVENKPISDANWRLAHLLPASTPRSPHSSRSQEGLPSERSGGHPTSGRRGRRSMPLCRRHMQMAPAKRV